MADVTRILSAIEHGDPSAADQLLPLVYDELRQLAAGNLAQEKAGQTQGSRRSRQVWRTLPAQRRADVAWRFVALSPG
jgi:hypothetical protein